MATDAERYALLDKLAVAMMETRPDLEQMSLDEWLMAHNDKLTVHERQAAFAILTLFDDD